MRQIKQLSKDTLIYGFGHFLKRSVGFLLIPIYTRFLSPVDYGSLELLNIMLSILLVVLSQGIGTSFFRSYAEVKDGEESTIKRLISTSYHYLILFSIVMCGLLMLNADWLADVLFNNNGSFAFLIKLILITVFFQTITLIPFQFFRANLESVKYVTISIIQFTIQLILTIYFVVVLKLSIKGVLLAGAISSFLAAGMTFFILKRNLKPTISAGILKDLLTFGVPLVPAALAFWILNVSDRILLEKLASTHELGLYSLGSRFANILTFLLIAPFQTAWGPMLFQIAPQKDGKETFKKVATYFLLAACLIGTLIIVFMPLVIKVIAGKEFWQAYRVVLPLVYANIAAGLFIVFQVGIYYFKKTKYAAYITMFGAGLNIGLNFIFIPKYGMMGAAFSSFISYLAILFLVNHVSQKYYRVQYETSRMLKICAIFLTTTGISQMVQFQHSVVDFMFRLFLIAIFCLSFYLIDFFDSNEKLFLKRIFSGLQQTKGWYNKLNFGINLIKN